MAKIAIGVNRSANLNLPHKAMSVKVSATCFKSKVLATTATFFEEKSFYRPCSNFVATQLLSTKMQP